MLHYILEHYLRYATVNLVFLVFLLKLLLAVVSLLKYYCFLNTQQLNMS